MNKIYPIMLKDIEKNPFRQFSIYALRADKIARLVESISNTDFWETVIGRRRKDGKVEIAFGHHRIEAAKRVFIKPDDTIPIIIKDLSDDEMRNMMIRENADEWRCTPAAIDDAVKATKDYLEANRDAAREALTSDRSEVKRVRVGAPAIAKYSGYPQSTVEQSLQRLGWIESGEIDAEAIYSMPNQIAAKRFAKAVRERPESKSHQKILAKHIVKEGTYGEASINQAFMEFVAIGKPTDPTNPRYYEARLKKATRLIKDAATALWAFDKLTSASVYAVGGTKEDISKQVIDNYIKALESLIKRIEMVGEVLDNPPIKPWVET